MLKDKKLNMNGADEEDAAYEAKQNILPNLLNFAL